jgi:hypothetical protein
MVGSFIENGRAVARSLWAFAGSDSRLRAARHVNMG